MKKPAVVLLYGLLFATLLSAQPVVMSSVYTRALGWVGLWRWKHSVGIAAVPELRPAVAAVCRNFNTTLASLGVAVEFYPASEALAHVTVRLADVPGPAIGLSQLEVFTDGYGEIASGTITVEWREPLEAVLLHELMHILGFQGHLDGFPSSLASGNTNTTLTPMDRLLLQAHYSP